MSTEENALAADENNEATESTAENADEAVTEESATSTEAEEATEQSDGDETTEEATDTDDAGDAKDAEGEEPDAEEQPKKSKSGFQKRISQLTDQKREYRSRAEAAEARVAELEAQLTPDGEAAPKEDDFENPDDYLVARAKYEAKQELRQEQLDSAKKQKQDAVEGVTKARKDTFAERVNEARETFKDFDDVALRDDLPVSDTLAEVIQTAEKGPEVLYHLGNNPDEAARLSNMDSVSAAIAVGEIAAKLQLPARKTTTSAPDPIDPVVAKGKPRKNLNDASPDEYAKMRGLDSVSKRFA